MLHRQRGTSDLVSAKVRVERREDRIAPELTPLIYEEKYPGGAGFIKREGQAKGLEVALDS